MSSAQKCDEFCVRNDEFCVRNAGFSGEFVRKMEDLIEQEASSGRTVLSKLCSYLNSHSITAKDLFVELDQDGTGDLDAAEFHAALVKVGVDVSEKAAQRAMKELDLVRFIFY